MAKLKLGPIADDKPVKVTVVPASLHRDLPPMPKSSAARRAAADPVRLIVPMLERFIATDRGFAKARRGRQPPAPIGQDDQGIANLTSRARQTSQDDGAARCRCFARGTHDCVSNRTVNSCLDAKPPRPGVRRVPSPAACPTTYTTHR
jgi:hypothetical protein